MLRPEDPRVTDEDQVSEEEIRPFVKVTLPLPPLLNDLYSWAPNRGKMLCREARRYRDAVCMLIEQQRHKLPTIAGRLSVTAIVYRDRKPENPDAPEGDRLGDIDAWQKCLYDSISRAELWLDDGQIKEQHTYLYDCPEDPRVEVMVSGLRVATPEEVKAAREKRERHRKGLLKGAATKARKRAERAGGLPVVAAYSRPGGEG
jgi:crossover junction endodeoxyribonuclease RusA